MTATLEPGAPATRARTYFLLTFGWSLGFWSLLLLLGGPAPGSALFYLGGAGPLVAALIVIHVLETAPARRDFWRRTFDPRLIPSRWLLVALTVHPLVVVSAQLVDLALGGTLAADPAMPAGPLDLATLVVFVLLFGPLPEEMGWRGVGLDRLQRRFQPLTASLVLGLTWAGWHLPLFFMAGTFQHRLGFAGPRFWIFMGALIPLSVLITWVYNHARRSILAAVLVHFTGNLCGALLDKSDRVAALELVGLVLAAAVVIAREGAALGRPPESTRR